MKHTLSFRNFRGRYFLMSLIICWICSFPASAQILIPPAFPDNYLSGASNTNATINVDALQSPAPGVLIVCVWDTVQGVGVEFTNPGVASLHLNIPQASMADVALSNDMSNFK